MSAVAMGLNARQLDVDLSALPAESENTTWDAATNTFAWSATYWNSTELFPGADYSGYTHLNYSTEAGTMDHFRLIFKFTDGTQVTYTPAEVGDKSLTWAEMGVSKDALKDITTIRLSGANDGTGDIKVNSFSLWADDDATPVTTYAVPEGSVDLKDLTGTEANWAATVVYPKTFAVQGQSFGNGDGSNESTHVNIDGYESLTVYISNSSTGLGLRTWIWNGSGVTTLYFYPQDQYDTADFTVPYQITAPGNYSVKVQGYQYLKGIKAANDWNASPLTCEIAFANPSGHPDAIVNIPTGLNGVNAAQAANIFYNILGQRVAAPVKGQMYIMNGRKVVIK